MAVARANVANGNALLEPGSSIKKTTFLTQRKGQRHVVNQAAYLPQR